MSEREHRELSHVTGNQRNAEHKNLSEGRIENINQETNKKFKIKCQQ